jgi:putative transposase
MSAEGAALYIKKFWLICPLASYISMAGKYLCVNIHMIWSTKSRRRLIHPQWASRLYAYLGGITTAKKAKLIAANSELDHIHLYVSMPSTISIAEMINAFKSNSTRWIRQTFPDRRWFSWQDGYGAFSVSRSQEPMVIAYIRNQQEHHRKHDFQQEFLELLREHGIEFDIKYVFD